MFIFYLKMPNHHLKTYLLYNSDMFFKLSISSLLFHFFLLMVGQAVLRVDWRSAAERSNELGRLLGRHCRMPTWNSRTVIFSTQIKSTWFSTLFVSIEVDISHLVNLGVRFLDILYLLNFFTFKVCFLSFNDIFWLYFL